MPQPHLPRRTGRLLTFTVCVSMMTALVPCHWHLPFTPTITQAQSSLTSDQERELIQESDRLNGLIAADGENMDARIALATLLLEGKNNIAAALEQTEAIQRKTPEAPRLNLLLYRIAESIGDESLKYHALTQLVKADHPMRPYWMRELNNYAMDSDERYQEVQALFSKISDDPKHGPLARLLLAGLLETKGQWDQARALRRGLGYIKQWRVIGPFKNERDAGFSQPAEPETEIDFDKAYEGRQGAVTWRELAPELIAPSGYIDFTDFMYPNDQSLAYAVTFLFSPVDQQAVLSFGAQASIKLWVNDQLCFADDRPHDFMMDQYTQTVSLKRGWNKVLVKLTRRDGAWRMAMRVTGTDYKPLPGLEISADMKPTPVVENIPDELPANFSPIQALTANAERQGSSDSAAAIPALDRAVDYMLLTEALLMEGRDQEAVNAAERAVSLAPYSASAHVLLALAYQRNQQSQKGLDHINAAIALNDSHFYAQRMLINHYLSNGLEDRALEMAEDLVENFPNSILAKQKLADVYSRKDFDEHRYRVIKELAEAAPARIDLNLRFNELKYARGDVAAYRFYVRQLGERFPRHYAVLQLESALLNEAHDETGKLARIERELSYNPHHIGIRYALVNQLIRMKKYNEARKALYIILQLQPQTPRVELLFADIYMRQGEDADAANALQSALAKDPRNTQARDYLRFLKPRKNAAFKHYALKPDFVQRRIADRVKPEQYPRANAALLVDFMITQLHKDGSTDNHVHQAIQIFNENGRDEYKTYGLPSYDTRVKIARVIKPDGKVMDATEIRGGQIHFARLQPGDIIEVMMEFHLGDRGWLSRQWSTSWFFQGNEPFIFSEFILLHDKERLITTRLQNADRVKASEEKFEKQIVKRWKVENAPVPELEPFRPPFNDIASKLELTTIDNWDELAQWQWSLTKDRFVADQAIKDKVAQLTKDATTRDEKIKAIADFVMREIQYKQDYTKPILGVQPHTAAQCFSNQRGDCKDKTTLLITMLKLVDIDAEFVMLKTRDQGDFRKDLPINQWNHAIAYVKPENPDEEGMYIDGTALWEAYDILPTGDQGVIATHLVDGKFTFNRIPIIPAERNASTRTVDITIAKDGSAVGTFKYALSGNLATGFRYNLQTPSKFLADIQRYVGGLYPGAKTAGFRHSKSTDMDHPAWVEVDVKLNNILRKNGDGFTLFEPASYRVEATRSYASQDKRVYDLRFNLAQSRIIKRVYKLPKNLAPQTTGVQNAENAYMSYERKIEFENNTLTVITEFKSKTIEIPKEAYPQIRDLCLEIDKLDQTPIVLKPTTDTPDEEETP